jgi:hypothetical protein
VRVVDDNLIPDKPDYGLVGPISIPEGQRVPDTVYGIATSAEYDRYFRLERRCMDLAEWTRSCLIVNGELTKDLDQSTISDRDKRDILVGIVTMQNVTLSHWLTAIAGHDKDVS